eukprot:2484428-Pyramimonas_sp.AAC.1
MVHPSRSSSAVAAGGVERSLSMRDATRRIAALYKRRRISAEASGWSWRAARYSNATLLEKSGCDNAEDGSGRRSSSPC